MRASSFRLSDARLWHVLGVTVIFGEINAFILGDLVRIRGIVGTDLRLTDFFFELDASVPKPVLTIDAGLSIVLFGKMLMLVLVRLSGTGRPFSFDSIFFLFNVLELNKLLRAADVFTTEQLSLFRERERLACSTLRADKLRTTKWSISGVRGPRERLETETDERRCFGATSWGAR